MKSTSSASASSTKGNTSARRAGRSDPTEPSAAVEVCPREQMIAEAAYFRAEQRGFAPGNEMSDWLQAEADVEAVLATRH